MARARRLVRNPAIPRLEWVAKNYPYDVLAFTVIGFFRAAGLDDAADDVWGAIAQREGQFWRGEIGQDAMKAGILDVVRHNVEGEYANTEYDRYIPWMAKSIRRVSKKPLKKFAKFLNEHEVELYYGGGYTTWYPSLLEMELEEGWSVGKDWGPEGRNLEWDVREASGKVRLIRTNFGTVARWANDTGAKPDDHEPMDAIDLAMDWARTRPKDENIVGGEVVYEFNDGWTFQELKTRAQLQYEGRYLDHCVKGYKPSRTGVDYRIFSLRDPEGLPVATLRWEIVGEYVQQYYGMSNSTPTQDAFERAVEFRVNYIEKNLVSDAPEIVPVDPSRWPPLADEWAGEFKGMYEFSGDPDTAFAVYDLESLDVRGRRGRILITMESLGNPRVWDTGSYRSMQELMLRPDGVSSLSPKSIEDEHDHLVGYGDEGLWAIWRATGALPFVGNDRLLTYVWSAPPSLWERLVQERIINPRKRKAKRKKVPEYKRLLNRSHRLWEAYDANPLKKNLVAFGKHIEKMKASESAKVKVEARRAARAFNSEFKARGWKAAAANPKRKVAKKRAKRNPESMAWRWPFMGTKAEGTMTVEELEAIADPNAPLDKMAREDAAYIRKLKGDIELRGFVNPVIVKVGRGMTPMIWDGHHRVIIARQMGIKEVPVAYYKGNPRKSKKAAKRKKAKKGP